MYKITYYIKSERNTIIAQNAKELEKALVQTEKFKSRMVVKNG
jgi:hypothetical protein